VVVLIVGMKGFMPAHGGISIASIETESFELDYYADFASEINDISYSLDAIYYDYPSEDVSPTADLTYYELDGSLSYTFVISIDPTIAVSVMHLPNFFG
jgi:hypothetical protein